MRAARRAPGLNLVLVQTTPQRMKQHKAFYPELGAWRSGLFPPSSGFTGGGNEPLVRWLRHGFGALIQRLRYRPVTPKILLSHLGHCGVQFR